MRGHFVRAGAKPRKDEIMSSKDYAKDVGMSTAPKTVPMPFFIVLIAVIVAGGYFGFSSAFKEHASAEKPAAVASK
jgi:hypothetical protein